MSRVLIRHMATVRQEYEATRAALSCVEVQWSQGTDAAALKGVSRSQIAASLRKLEQIYLTRLFSEFEYILISYLEDRAEVVPSKAFDLIDKVASRRRAKVPNETRQAVHLVREYRNATVHTSGNGAAAISFRQALSLLNQFLVFLPDPGPGLERPG